MKTVRSYGNIAEAGFAQSLLQAAGIDAFIPHEFAATSSPEFAIWRICVQVPGDREAAGKELSSYISNRKESPSPSGEWVGTIAGYLLGTVKEADFFAAAGSPNARKAPGHTCEAWYYAGMEKLLDGDRKTAAEYLQKCIATNRKDYVEYGLAQSELKALGK